MSPLASYVVETLITLVAIIALAVALLYGARRVGLGRPAGPLRLVGRLPLDGRRAVYLVRVGDTVYVLGSSEAGLQKVGEHAADALDLPPEQEPDPRLGHALARLLGKDRDGRER
jgi:flagellar biogenesis protein FliO